LRHATPEILEFARSNDQSGVQTRRELLEAELVGPPDDDLGRSAELRLLRLRVRGAVVRELDRPADQHRKCDGYEQPHCEDDTQNHHGQCLTAAS
jgi:hypothetical protein